MDIYINKVHWMTVFQVIWIKFWHGINTRVVAEIQNGEFILFLVNMDCKRIICVMHLHEEIVRSIHKDMSLFLDKESK